MICSPIALSMTARSTKYCDDLSTLFVPSYPAIGSYSHYGIQYCHSTILNESNCLPAEQLSSTREESKHQEEVPHNQENGSLFSDKWQSILDLKVASLFLVKLFLKNAVSGIGRFCNITMIRYGHFPKEFNPKMAFKEIYACILQFEYNVINEVLFIHICN